jgi:hypothetical protein
VFVVHWILEWRIFETVQLQGGASGDRSAGSAGWAGVWVEGNGTVCVYCLLYIICTNKRTYMYIIILNYITNTPTCFSAPAPFSGSSDSGFVKVM